VRECPVPAGDGGFGRETLSPEVAAQMVSDFVEVLAFDFLQDDAAVADDFLDVVLGLGISRRCQLHCPEADAIVPVALAVAFDPLLDTGAIVRCGVIAHGFGIGENQGECVGILLDELAQLKSGGFEDYL